MGLFSRNKDRKPRETPRPATAPPKPNNSPAASSTTLWSSPPQPQRQTPYPQSGPLLRTQQSQPQFQQWTQAPLIVNQHYYITPNPPDCRYQQQSPYGLKGLATSVIDLAKDAVAEKDGLAPWQTAGALQLVNNTLTAADDLCRRFDQVMTLIDRERMAGDENKLFSCSGMELTPMLDPVPEKAVARRSKKDRRARSEGADAAMSVVSGTYFSKVELYANSRLPSDLPPLALYMPTWPLLCLAAQYSTRVYDSPKGAEREAHVSADWRAGTKAMCLKSVPMDSMSTIVFAIRGTSSFMDWAVNLNTAPTSPSGFLDDAGNLCHAGFLSVAKKMVAPVAARLRQMLREDPSRKRHSLLITGHSAGGSVAALLYCHMLAESRQAGSELNILTGSFKRVHCVTFGAPPVSLLPLQRPGGQALRKSLFLSFVNEGDPVVRADKAYVRSLLELLASPPPAADHKKRAPRWQVPPCTLSNAGRIIVLRSGSRRSRDRRKGESSDRKSVKQRLDEGVVAVTCQEDQLRGVIWGDPVAHMMSLYAGRVETLAVGAVTVKRG